MQVDPPESSELDGSRAFDARAGTIGSGLLGIFFGLICRGGLKGGRFGPDLPPPADGKEVPDSDVIKMKRAK